MWCMQLRGAQRRAACHAGHSDMLHATQGTAMLRAATQGMVMLRAAMQGTAMLHAATQGMAMLHAATWGTAMLRAAVRGMATCCMLPRHRLQSRCTLHGPCP